MSYTLNIYNNVHNNSPFEAMKCRAVRDLERKTDSRCLFSTVYHSGSTSPLPSSAPEKPPARHPCSGAIWTLNLVKFLHPIEDTKSQNPYSVWRQIPVWIKERVSFLPGAGPLEKLEKLKVRDLFRFLRM